MPGRGQFGWCLLHVHTGTTAQRDSTLPCCGDRVKPAVSKGSVDCAPEAEGTPKVKQKTLTGTAQHVLFENRIFGLGNEELS